MAKNDNGGPLSPFHHATRNSIRINTRERGRKAERWRFRKVAASVASYHFFCQLIFRHGSEPVKRSVERGPRASYGGHSSASTNETGISSHDSLFYRFSSHGSTLFRLIRRPSPKQLERLLYFSSCLKKLHRDTTI